MKKYAPFILVALLLCGCVTSTTVEEWAGSGLGKELPEGTTWGDIKSQPSNDTGPMTYRKTHAWTWNPWAGLTLPKNQGKLTSTEDMSSIGEQEWYEPISGSGMTILYIIGGIIIAAGLAIAIFLKDWVNGGLVAIGGAGVIALGVLLQTYPWITLVLVVVALGVGGWLFWEMYVKRRHQKTAKLTVAAIERFRMEQPSAWKKLKPYLTSSHTDARTTAHVNKLRSKVSR